MTGRPDDTVEWGTLMARAQDGDADAYLQLLAEITPYLRFRAARMLRDPRDAEEAVQDILLTLHAVRKTYDPARPFGPWLIAIASRRLIDRLRRAGRHWAHEVPLTLAHEAALAGPGPALEGLDRHILDRAIAALPPLQQQAIRLLKLEEMSLKEASSVTGVSVTSLKVATHRAIKRLRGLLSGGEGAA